MIILDTSGLLAAIDSSQRFHTAAKRALEAASGPLLLSPFVLAELDYMILAHVGRGQEITLLEEVARGTYRLEPFSAEDVARAMEVIKQHADLELGLADASNVVLAARYDTYDILTLDERHFRALAGPQERPFRLFPADL